jgi:hypothetical protein
MGNIVSNMDLNKDNKNNINALKEYYSKQDSGDYDLRSIPDTTTRNRATNQTKLTQFINQWALGNNISDGYLNYDDGFNYKTSTSSSTIKNCNLNVDKLLIKRGCCSRASQVSISLPLYNGDNNMIVDDFRYAPVNIQIATQLDDNICNINNTNYRSPNPFDGKAPSGCQTLYGSIDTGGDISDCIFCKHIKNERIDMINNFSKNISDSDYGNEDKNTYKKNTSKETGDSADIFDTYFKAYGRYHIDIGEQRNVYQDCNCINSVISDLYNDMTLSGYFKNTTDNTYSPSAQIKLSVDNVVHYFDTKCSQANAVLPNQIDKIECILINNLEKITITNNGQLNIQNSCGGGSEPPTPNPPTPTPPTQPPTPQPQPPTPQPQPPTPPTPTNQSSNKTAPTSNVFLSTPVIIASSVSIIVLVILFMIKHFHLFIL